MVGRGSTPLPTTRGRGRRSHGSVNYGGRRANRGSGQSVMRRGGSSLSIGAHASILHEDDILSPNMEQLNVDDEGEQVHLSEEEEEAGDQSSRARDATQAKTNFTLVEHGNDLFCDESGKWLLPQLGSQLSCAIKDRMKEGDAWPSWRKIPNAVKELMCEEWMARFNFDEVDKANAKREFYKSGSNMVRSMMYKAREAAKKKFKAPGVNNAIKNGRPPFITEENWVAMVDSWMQNDWRAKSKIGSDNRTSSGRFNSHTFWWFGIICCY